MSDSEAQRKRRVFVVEDHAVVREGIVRLINDEDDLEVCGQADCAEEALRGITANPPAIAIVDLSLKNSSGLDLIQSLRDKLPQLPVLVLSMHDESLHAERALRAGARGYVMKQEPPTQLMEAIRQVLAGQIHLSSAMSNRLLTRLVDKGGRMDQSPLERLTDREFEIYNLIGEGLGASEIAQRLGLSVKTIDAHRENIKRKLGLKTATELSRYAMQNTRNPWVNARK